MIALYLDYDGVLHDQEVIWHHMHGPVMLAAGHVLFEHAHYLEAILADRPQVQIVLSTSWVRELGVAGAAQFLPESVRERVIGGTFDAQTMQRHAFAQLPRSLQILQDVQRRRPADWLALDDDVDEWAPAAREHLVYAGVLGLGLGDEAVRRELASRIDRMLR